MPSKKESAADVERWFNHNAASLWPAALGSLSLRRSTCIREQCEACLKGEKHASHFLYVRTEGRRFTIYIPDELVPRMRRSLDNGRQLQELLCQAAIRYAKALKHERTAKIEEAKK